MQYPLVDVPQESRTMLSTFMGYNHQQRISDGEWYDCLNLTTDEFPILSQMPSRTKFTRNWYFSPLGFGINGKHVTYTWLDPNNGKYYAADRTINDDGTLTNTSLFEIDGTTQKQFVNIGAYVCIFPDNKYYNTQNLSDKGDIGNSVTKALSGSNVLTGTMCNLDGVTYTPTVSATAPVSPQNGDYWLDTSSVPYLMKRYNSNQSMWVDISTTYIKLSLTGIGSGFSVGDGINIDVSNYAAINGANILEAVTANSVIITGLITTGGSFTVNSGTFAMTRDIPDMDYVCECNNRLWGCKYGGGINELYCSKLGDFKNWRTYQGVSTDAWAASVGTDGEWTGCIAYDGYPTFFKEKYIHKVYISSTGAHQVSAQEARGVQKGCSRSLAVCNETLYYKNRIGIMAYTGSVPSNVSECFGNEFYTDAVAGSLGNKYYVSMKNGSEDVTFCYDTVKNIWHRESPTKAICYANYVDNLMWEDNQNYVHYTYIVNNSLVIAETDPTLFAVEPIEWMAETGIIGFEQPDEKYISRYNVRMKLEDGASVTMFIEYDSDGDWHNKGTITAPGMRSVTLPVLPVRCDHMKVRFVGSGRCRIYSIARILETGSDVV